MYIQHLSRSIRGIDSLTVLDYSAAVILLVAVLSVSVWWVRRRIQRKNFARACRARGLSTHERREVSSKGKDGLVSSRQIDHWQDPKFKVLKQGRRVVGVRVTVRPGVGRERVEAARDDLGSVFGLDLLPPQRDGKNHNRYTFSAATFSKKSGSGGDSE